MDQTHPHDAPHQDIFTEFKPDFGRDRREHARTDTGIAVKLRRCANAVFTGGRTIDLSMGGASVELMGPREAHEGERVAIAFENLACPVTRAVRMIGAQVVRVQPLRDGCQRVAVRFDSPQAGLAGLRLPRAA